MLRARAGAGHDVTQSARTLELPPADRARIFVFTGRSPLFIDGSGPLTQHNLAADIYVDEVKIGTVNPGEAMVFDVAPGRYTFSWTPYNRKAGWGETMMTAAFNFRGGTIVGISADQFRYTYSLQPSVMTPLLEKDQNRLRPDVKIVRAALCPPSLCL